MKRLFVLTLIICTALAVEVMAAQYNHNITLQPKEYSEVKIHLDEGDVIKVYAISIDSNTFWVKIYGPFGDKVFSASSSSTLNKSYKSPASGEYTIKIVNDAAFSDVTVGYTITARCKGLIFTGSHDIKFPGSEF
jgi:hypothetical protein